MINQDQEMILYGNKLLKIMDVNAIIIYLLKMVMIMNLVLKNILEDVKKLQNKKLHLNVGYY